MRIGNTDKSAKEDEVKKLLEVRVSVANGCEERERTLSVENGPDENMSYQGMNLC